MSDKSTETLVLIVEVLRMLVLELHVLPAMLPEPGRSEVRDEGRCAQQRQRRRQHQQAVEDAETGDVASQDHLHENAMPVMEYDVSVALIVDFHLLVSFKRQHLHVISVVYILSLP